MGWAHPRNAPYQVFHCRDGYFGMAAGNNALWAAVCRAVGRPEWLDDDRFTTPSYRARHQDQLRSMLEALFAAEDAPFWLEKFRAAGVPCAPINQYLDVLADPQVEHMQWVIDRAYDAQVRLCRRYRRLAARSKNANTTVVAVAHELSGFIWDIERLAIRSRYLIAERQPDHEAPRRSPRGCTSFLKAA